MSLTTLAVYSAFAYNVYCLLQNYQRASKLGLPVVLCPISPTNSLWIALQTGFSPLFQCISFDATSFTRHCRLGWEFHDRYKTHQKLGDAWVLVTPQFNWLYVAEAGAASEIFSRNKDFGRPVWMLAALDVFGPNVSTAEGVDWQRQRKLTATPFNEQNNYLVWKESLQQAKDMLNWWKSEDTTRTSEDVRTLALHVLAYAAFRQSYSFGKVGNSSTTKDPSTYRDSLSLILRNALVIMVLPELALSIPFLPTKWTQIGKAIKNFKRYMLEIMDEEKRLAAEGRQGSGNLVSNLVRASDPALAKSTSNVGMAAGKTHDVKPLSVDEVLGNIFVFNFAGHDTTAISLAYAVLLLVAHPQVQGWISTELQSVLPSPNSDDWNYNEAFPRLQRCLAVLFETLRLYNPLPGVPKWTGNSTQTLKVNDISHLIPPKTLVVPNLMALHTHPRYWGENSLDWCPSRWIKSSTDTNTTSADAIGQLRNEHFSTPTRGSYIAWSDGARNCPGKKFAQVEFVAVMAILFRDHRAEPVPLGSETLEQARERVLQVVKKSNVELLLQMRNPDSVAVRWSHR